MIKITNSTKNKEILSVDGFFLFTYSKLDLHYNINVIGLTGSPFDVDIESESLETRGEFDHDKVLNVLLLKMRQSVEVASGESFFDNDLQSNYIGHTANKYEHKCELSGEAMIALIDEDESWNRLRFHKAGGFYFDFLVNKKDEVLSEGIDPGKLLRWLLEKMKEYVCPDCL